MLPVGQVAALGDRPRRDRPKALHSQVAAGMADLLDNSGRCVRTTGPARLTVNVAFAPTEHVLANNRRPPARAALLPSKIHSSNALSEHSKLQIELVAADLDTDGHTPPFAPATKDPPGCRHLGNTQSPGRRDGGLGRPVH